MAGPVFEDMSKRPAKEGGFAMIQHWMLRGETNLTLQEAMVYMVLTSRRNATGHAWPSVRLIAHDAIMSESAAKRALKGLEKRGRITKTIRPKGDGTNDSNMYWVKSLETALPLELAAPGGFCENPPWGSDRTPPGVCVAWEEYPLEEEPYKEDMRSNLTVGRDSFPSDSDSAIWPMPAVSEGQFAYIRDLFILYTGEIPNARTQAGWEQLDTEQAHRLVNEYLAKIGRYQDYAGPEAGEPAYEALSDKGKAFADATMLPGLVMGDVA
jgi:hypothetical protein